MDEARWQLLHQINLNGIKAMEKVKDGWSGKNDSYFDLKIGMATTKLALELYGNKVPNMVREFLELHYKDESTDAHLFPLIKNELADKIAEYHQRILKEQGLVAYFACMPLCGERMALADAHYFHHKTDPHATKDGFLREYYHGVTPLIMIGVLDPSLTELQIALKVQEKFLDLIKGW